MVQPYITSSNGLARADPSRLINHEDRKLSDQVKRVEHPVKVKEKTNKVSIILYLSFTTAYEEITPFPLMQKLRSRFGYMLCNTESNLTHSYSEASFSR